MIKRETMRQYLLRVNKTRKVAYFLTDKSVSISSSIFPHKKTVEPTKYSLSEYDSSGLYPTFDTVGEPIFNRTLSITSDIAVHFRPGNLHS